MNITSDFLVNILDMAETAKKYNRVHELCGLADNVMEEMEWLDKDEHNLEQEAKHLSLIHI